MKINPEIAYSELAAQHEFLKGRNLVLAQAVADRASERDQLQAELTAMQAARDALAAELDAVKNERDDLLEDRRVTAELQEEANGAAE